MVRKANHDGKGPEREANRMLTLFGWDWYEQGLSAYREYVRARATDGRVFAFSKREIAAIVEFERYEIAVEQAAVVLDARRRDATG